MMTLTLSLQKPNRGCPGVDGCVMLVRSGTVDVHPMEQNQCPHQNDVPRGPGNIGLCWYRYFQEEVAAGRSPKIYGEQS